MQVFAKHGISFPDIPAGFSAQFDSTALYYPNAGYDPERGADQFNEWLDLLEYCEVLGFDGVSYGEHHQWPLALAPSANILSAALMRRTTRLKLAPLGYVVPARHPLQLAEEIAMIDIISRGRVIAGVTRGVGTEYYARNVTPADGRDLFSEQMDLIVRAWTSRAPFVHDGKFYQFPCVNIWPRPLQQPHPPIWVASSGSRSTIAWAASRRYPLVTGFDSTSALAATITNYRLAAAEMGYQVPDSQIGLNIPIYLADTDEAAMRQATPHFEYLFRSLLKTTPELYAPPGSGPLEEVQRASLRVTDWQRMSVADLNKRGDIIIGSPATVVEKLSAIHERIRYGILVVDFASGQMTGQEARGILESFAADVLPAVRRLSTERSNDP